MWLTARPWFNDQLYWFEEGVIHSWQKLYKYNKKEISISTVVSNLVDNNSLSFREVFGGGLVVWGSAMLVPGPVDVAVGAAGAYFGGPIGAVAAIVGYNLFALVVIGIGMYLIYTG